MKIMLLKRLAEKEAFSKAMWGGTSNEFIEIFKDPKWQTIFQ
jgi:hypothetical protein